MSRAIAILWLGAGSSLVSASSPKLNSHSFGLAVVLRCVAGSGEVLFPPVVPFSLSRRCPSVRETGKRDGCRVANHGPIGDSWPRAFFGHPRGHRVFIETRCLRHTGPTTAFDTLPRNRASQQSDGSPPRMIPRMETTVCPRRSSGLRFHTLGIGMRSFLPNR